jgi:hypothetical protein
MDWYLYVQTKDPQHTSKSLLLVWRLATMTHVH